MARNYLAAVMLLGLALGGCGKKENAADQAVDLAALRVKRDSVARAKVRADSIALVRYTTCSDSVTAALSKTSAGRRAVNRAKTAGTPVAEVVSVCGQAGSGPAPQVAVEDSTRRVPQQAVTPAATTPPAAAPGGMTPQQRQVARADSIRRAREQARADSVRQAGEVARADSVARMVRDSARSDSLRQQRETEVLRETFTYSGANRDPFISLINLPTEGPEFANLQLVAIYQDLRYAGNSIAVVRDKAANKRYSVRVGDRIGRLKVAQIRQRDVVITIEDLGFERQETLSLRRQEEHNP